MKSVLTDLCCCGLGYFLGAIFLALEMVWLSGLWIAASEVRSLQYHCLNIVHVQIFCVLWFRDSLVMRLVNMVISRCG